jgi:hypothetical protein
MQKKITMNGCRCSGRLEEDSFGHSVATSSCGSGFTVNGDNVNAIEAIRCPFVRCPQWNRKAEAGR